MSTESPIIFVETSRKWPLHKEAAEFGSASMAAEELDLLLKDPGFQGNGRDALPNRSESAPPNIEGSFVAFENLMSKQNFSFSATLADLKSAIGSYKSEQYFCADPDYLAYNFKLNPRLPRTLISLEDRCPVRHVGNYNDRRFLSFDDTGNGSLHLSESNLPTHEEESEEDRSPQQVSDDGADRSSDLWSEHTSSSSGQRKDSVDILKDNRQTSSPVYNEFLPDRHHLVEEAVDEADDPGSLHESSVVTSNATISSPDIADTGLSLYPDLKTTTIPSSSSLDGLVLPASNKRQLNIADSHLKDTVVTNGVSESDITRIESAKKAIGLSSLPNPENHKNRTDRQHSRQDDMVQKQVGLHQSHTFEDQGGNSNMISLGIHQTYVGMNQFPHGSSNFPSKEVQKVHQSSGLTPPLYATAAPYMNFPIPVYPNLQPSGYFPQYVLGGYALNAIAGPSFVAGYPHGAMPVADNSAGPSFKAQTAGVLPGGSTAHAVDMQYLNNYYVQLGHAVQPSFTGPLNMHYFQHSFGDADNVPGRYDHLTSKNSTVRNQVSKLDSRRGAGVASCSTDQKFQHHGIGGLNILNPRRGETLNHYFRNPTNSGFLVQFPTSPTSPVLPGSVAGTTFSGGNSELRFQPGPGRNVGIHPGWQGQRVLESPLDNKPFSFLEELRSGRGRRFELIDIAGHIVEFSADQHGSRFIQQKLENCSVEEKVSVFKEVLPHASNLMTDVFGNYVIQKFFEYGSPEQKKELAKKLEGQILPLSFQMYGCRVIQKALEVIAVEQKLKLVHELDGHVMRCVRDQNGNHVIQKCIESIPTDEIGFIISAFRGEVAKLSTHPYGCRVIQRILEHCTYELQFILDEILESVYALAEDQYGNYVTQHVLERGSPHERSQIINKLSGHIVRMSQHKFASNVVEKCLEHGNPAEREVLIRDITGYNGANDNLLVMMKDQYANYVVQKILETCTDSQRESLLRRISIHLNSLKKYTYGKHIAARFEQLYGEEMRKSET